MKGKKESICWVKTCKRKADRRLRGMCPGHYARAYRDTEPIREIGAGRTCISEGCGRAVHARNLCMTCYQSKRREHLAGKGALFAPFETLHVIDPEDPSRPGSTAGENEGRKQTDTSRNTRL